jgi:hypothetical protein
MNKRSAAWVPDGIPGFSPGSRHDASFDRSEVILREGGIEIRIVELETNRGAPDNPGHVRERADPGGCDAFRIFCSAPLPPGFAAGAAAS